MLNTILYALLGLCVGALFLVSIAYIRIKIAKKLTIQRYERLREILVSELGIVKAADFSYERLEKIFAEVKKHKEEFRENPLLMYEFVTRTEDIYVNDNVSKLH